MFSFFFVRTKRRLRTGVRLLRRRVGLRPQHTLRYLGFFFIFFLSIFSRAPLSGEASVGSPSAGGEVAGAEAPSPFEAVLQEEEYSPTYPRRIPNSDDLPPLTARAILVLDGENGKILYKKNIHEPLSPASLTKIMTALVSLERYSLDEELLVPANCLLGLEGRAQMGLLSGERVSVETLLYGLLLNSASDAACVLARGAQSEVEFVGLMNQRAQKLGLSETSFDNPVGLDGAGNYSSAWDLVVLAQEAMGSPVFRKIAGTAEATRVGFVSSKKQGHSLKSTNALLSDPTLSGVTGVKTGKTVAAGECLIASWIWQDREIFSAVLGSEDRFAEMTEVLSWVRQVFSMSL